MRNSVFYNINEDGCKEECRENWVEYNTIIEAGDGIQEIRKKVRNHIAVVSSFLKENFPQKNMMFYVWFDNLSGVLNASCVSDIYKILPFEVKIRETDDLDKIIQDYLNDEYKGIIPLEEFKEDMLRENEEVMASPLDVYVLKVPL